MTEFEQLFENNRELIFKYLIKLTRDISLAEELTQETFFRAYMNFATLKDKEKAFVWLCQIAKNTYYAYYNEEKKKAPIDDYENLTDGTDVEESFLKSELTQKALSCLHDLEEPYKEVFQLRVFGELSFAQIASIFRKTESWVRVTYHRARLKIQERMD